MEYTVKAHPTEYRGVLYRSRLEARWAAFFDYLCGWSVEYEPIDLNGWTPDFRVAIPCGHSECASEHVLLVEVKPFYRLEEFESHICMKYAYAHPLPAGADAIAMFGVNPHVSRFDMVHGAGSGVYSVSDWVNGDVDILWKRAGELVQWHPPINTRIRANDRNH